MLSGDNGQYLQQEISKYKNSNTQMYVAVDQGWVNGKNSIAGQRHLMGSVVGLRSYLNHFILMPLQARPCSAESIKRLDIWI